MTSTRIAATSIGGALLGVAVIAGLPATAWAAGPVTSIVVENDLFGGTDQNYTNGLRLSWISGANEVHPILRSAARLLPWSNIGYEKCGVTPSGTTDVGQSHCAADTRLRQGIEFGHAIFTPEDIGATDPDPADRPYAGWLYVSGTAVATTGDVQDTVQLNLGMVGPSALGEQVQVNWHKLIDGREPRGWESQLEDELGVELLVQHQRRFDGPKFGDLQTDWALHGVTAVGNVRTYAGVGAMARVGFDLDADFGPPRVRPALASAGVFNPRRPVAGYLFAGLEGRAIARDIFLDGNTFRDGPSVSKFPLVADAQAGVALNLLGLQLTFTYVHRSRSFEGQKEPDQFGAVSISFAQ